MHKGKTRVKLNYLCRQNSVIDIRLYSVLVMKFSLTEENNSVQFAKMWTAICCRPAKTFLTYYEVSDVIFS